MSEELKSCPFCGSRALKIMVPYYTFVYCAACGAEGAAEASRSDAITAWNTRAGEKA